MPTPAPTSLNPVAIEAWAASGPDVLHISGERDYDDLRGRVDRPGYVLVANTPDFGAALAAADLAVAPAARSGSLPPPGRPPCWCRTPMRPPTTRP